MGLFPFDDELHARLAFIVGHHHRPRRLRDVSRAVTGAPQGALYPFPFTIMDDRQNTIGMTDLLDEVSRDLDDFRKKHASDYSVKNITLWWELERDRLVARHSPASVVRKLRRAQGLRLLIWFFAGSATLLAIDTVIRLLVP